MDVKFTGIRLSALATSLPKHRFDMLQLSTEFGATDVKRIIASTGIQAIHSSRQQTILTLSQQVAEHLLQSLNIPVPTIDAIVFVSQTSEYAMPATSVILQHQLKLSNHVVAFDINYGCSGYIYGLYQASMLIAAGGCRRVLVFAGDVLTPFLNPSERDVRMVFGDGASVSLVEEGEDTFAFSLNTDGSGAEHLKLKKNSDYLYMNGLAIMEFVLRAVPEQINHLLEIVSWQKKEVGAFILHQANQLILHYLRKKLQLTADKVPIEVKETGNTGPASIPLLLSICGDELKQKNQLSKVILSGFGVGLSWATMAADLSKTHFMTPIYV